MVMVGVTDIFRKAVLATANTVQRAHKDLADPGAPLRQQIHKQLDDFRQDLAAKLIVSQSAQAVAAWGARRLPAQGLGRAAHSLARRPLMASGVALWTYGAIGDGLQYRRGEIDFDEIFERSSANAGGLLASAGGAALGASLGGILLPVIGAPIGGVLGGMVASSGGDHLGRRMARRLMNRKKQDN